MPSIPSIASIPPRHGLAHMLAAALLVAATLGQNAARAGEGAAPVPKPDELAKALVGFRGFLVGQLVEANDDGVVLFVEAVTLVKGSQAPNPGILLGQKTTIKLATEKDDAGNDRPIAGLVQTARRLRDLPPMAFHLGPGNNAVVMVNPGGAPGQGGGPPPMIQMQAQNMIMQFQGGGPAPPDAGGEPQGPIVTARVRADDGPALVMDRVLPGSHPAHRWDAMPKLIMHDVPQGAGMELPDKQAFAQAFKHLAQARAQLKRQMKELAALRARGDIDDHAAQARARALRQQMAQLEAQLRRHKEMLARLKALKLQQQHMAGPREPRPQPPRPPARGPDDTDF